MVPADGFTGSLGDVARPPGWKATVGPCEKACEVHTMVPPAAWIEGAPLVMYDLDTGTTGARFGYDPRLDLFLWVVDGKIQVTLDQGGPTVDVAPWQLVRVRGGGAKVASSSSSRVVVVAARLDQKPIEAPNKAYVEYKVTDREPIAFFDAKKREHLTWGKGAFHFWTGQTAASLALNALLARKDAGVPAHQHDKEWECLFALDGEGELVLGEGGKDGVVPMGPGQKVCVPPGKIHQWKPKGTRPLVAVQAYSPPGPEQRFKKLAETP